MVSLERTPNGLKMRGPLNRLGPDGQDAPGEPLWIGNLPLVGAIFHRTGELAGNSAEIIVTLEVVNKEVQPWERES